MNTNNTLLSSAAYKRLEALFDAGTLTEIDARVRSGSSLAEVITAYGTVNGRVVYAFSQNTEYSGGAVSKEGAAKVNKLLDYAAMNGAPVVGIYDSEGARLRQGTDVLDAYGTMLMRVSELSGVVPQISVVAGVCIGTNSLLAASADVVICCEKAEYGVETAGGEVGAKKAAASGNAHILAADDMSAMQEARRIVSILPSNNLESAPELEYAEPSQSLLRISADRMSSSEEVMFDVIRSVVDEGSFIELSRDFGKAAVTGFAGMEGRTVGIVATRWCENNGVLDHEATAKAARFVRMCDGFSIPVVSFVDVLGFTSVRESAMLAHAYAEATTVKLSVITGTACGAAYIALAGRAAHADVTVAWPKAVIAPLAPETASMLLLGDKLKKCDNPAQTRKDMLDEYKRTIGSAKAAAAGGNIEDIIDPVSTRTRLCADLAMMAGKRVHRKPKKHSNIQL